MDDRKVFVVLGITGNQVCASSPNSDSGNAEPNSPGLSVVSAVAQHANRRRPYRAVRLHARFCLTLNNGRSTDFEVSRATHRLQHAKPYALRELRRLSRRTSMTLPVWTGHLRVPVSSSASPISGILFTTLRIRRRRSNSASRLANMPTSSSMSRDGTSPMLPRR